tara:strand:- start:236 stop:451 length:216 start_codon:yes stop_codon:yes gene_type:complete
MTDGLKASQIKGGIRPSKSFEQGRVCNDESCETKLSIYNKRDHCFNHAPVKYQELEEEFFRKLPKKPKLPN